MGVDVDGGDLYALIVFILKDDGLSQFRVMGVLLHAGNFLIDDPKKFNRIKVDS